MAANIESRVFAALVFVISNEGLELNLPAPPPQNTISVSESGYEFSMTKKMPASEQIDQQLK